MAKNNYEVFSAEINFTLKGISDVLKEIKSLQKELNKTVKGLSESFVLKADAKTFQEILKATKTQTEAEVELGEAKKQQRAEAKAAAREQEEQRKAQDDFNESLRRTKTLLGDSAILKEKTGVDALNSSMGTLKDTIAAVKNNQEGLIGAVSIAQKGFAEITASTSNLKRGLDLAFADTGGQYNRVGQVALGLRTAIFGVKDAADVTNPRMKQLYGILDRVTNSTISANKATGAYAAAAVELSDKITEFNSDMVAAIDNLKKSAKSAGLDVANDLARISNRFKDSAKQVQSINNALMAGNMVKANSLTAAYTKSVISLEKEFERLNKQGVIPTEASLAKLRAELSKATDPKERQALKTQLKQQEELKTVYDETAKSVEVNRKALQQLGVQAAAAANNSKTGMEKLKAIFGGLWGNMKKTKDEAKGTGDSLFLTGRGMDNLSGKTGIVAKSMEGLTKTASTFKDVMLGTFAGNLLFAGISKIGNLITTAISAPIQAAMGYVSGLKDQFMEANNTVQNFDVTLKQMLTGFDEDKIEKAMKGANDYIRSVIAKTPFELSTGQAAFQQLITGGLDPREWLMPAADAAAAFNKPMEQLIFAIQRLKAGSKGIGVDMIRDFGIPVQQVGVWLNNTTGELASFEDVNSKTKEELEASGYAFKQWAFNAAGSLEQAPTEAIEILNGYLKQNAVVSGASAARSRTLTGVLSNMGDAVTSLLTAFGQPIFKTITDVLGDIYMVINELMTTVEPFAKLIGEGLANSFQSWWSALTGIPPVLDGVDEAASKLNETLRIDRFKEIANSILTYLKPALSVILLLVRGDWSKAWGVFLNLAKTAIQNVAKFLQTTGKDAFKWGAQFVGMIAKGLASAAKSVLSLAVKGIASTIGRFLKPGSPPKEGPLSDIDKWGRGLIQTFGEGFKNADFGFMQEALAPIKDFFLQSGQEGAYSEVRDTVAGIIKGINQTGQIDEAQWAKVEKRLGKANIQMSEYLRAELQLRGITKEVQDAEANGFVSKELSDRLDAAQTLVALKKEEMELADAAKQRAQQAASEKSSGGSSSKSDDKGEDGTDYKQAYKDEVKFLEKKKKIGLITEEEYLNELQGLNKQYAETALQAGDEGFAKELVKKAESLQSKIDDARLKQELKDLRKQIEKEKTVLEYKYKNGLITEQEYREGLTKIQENYVEQLLGLGQFAMADKEMAKLKSLQAELKKLTDIPLDKPADLLGSFSEDLSSSFEDMLAEIEGSMGGLATSTWEDLKSTFSESFTPIWDELKNEISTSVNSLFGGETGGGLKDGLKNTFSELWAWFTGDDGPLATGTQLFKQLSEQFLGWAKGEGKEKFSEIGKVVGETLVNGIYAALGWAKDDAGKGESSTIKGILEGISNFLTGARELLAGGVEGFAKAIVGDTWGFLLTGWLSDGWVKRGYDAWKEIFNKLFDAQVLQASMTEWVENATNNIPVLFETMRDIITNTLTGWADKVKSIFYDLYMYLVGGSIVPDMVNEIVDWIYTLKDRVVGYVKDLKSEFLDNFAVLVNTVTLGGFDWLDFFNIDLYSDVLTGLKEAGIIGLKKAFTALFEFTKTQIGKFLGKKILEALGVIEKPVASGLGKIIAKIGPAVLDALPGVFTFLLEEGPKILKVAGFISRLIPPLTLLVSLWQNLNRFVLDRVNGIADSLRLEFEGIKQLLDGLYAGGSAILSWLFGKPEDAAASWETFRTDVLMGITNVMTGVTGAILDLGGGIAQLMISDTAGMFGTFFQWLGGQLDSYNIQMFGLLLSSLDLGFGQLITKAKEILLGLKDQVMTILTLTKDDSGLLWKTMGDALTMTLNDTVTKLKEGWNEFSGWLIGEDGLIKKLVDSVTEWFGITLPENVMGALPEFVDGVVAKFQEMIDGILGLDIPGKITGIFDGLQTRMTDSGGKLVENLKSGISSYIPSLEGTVTTVAGSIRDYFPFSPAKKGPLSQPIGWGNYLPIGLPETMGAMAQTVNEGLGAIKQQVDSAASEMSNTMSNVVHSPEGTRLDKPQGGGFGNYGKKQKAPNFSGGIAATWKRLFTNVKNGTSKLGSGTYKKYASGSWSVPKTMKAVVHKGEMIIPKNRANDIRTGRNELSGENYQFQENAFAGAFPNVKNGGDAKDFLKQLDTLTKKSSLKGRVVKA